MIEVEALDKCRAEEMSILITNLGNQIWIYFSK